MTELRYKAVVDCCGRFRVLDQATGRYRALLKTKYLAERKASDLNFVPAKTEKDFVGSESSDSDFGGK